MTREEAIYFANCLKNNYTVDLNDMEAFCDMAIKALEQELVMKITVIEYGGIEHYIHCASFEFRTNQVANWVKIKFQDGSQEMIYGVATIKAEMEDKK